MRKLKSILEKFQSVSLEEASGVKLMNRADQKYWFHYSHLEHLISHLAPLYNVLEVNGKRMIGYQTVYFETDDNLMYLHHHNGFRDRYKVRRRKYETSECGFFEIKRKTNKQRTIKKRIESPFHEGDLSETESNFLRDNTSYKNLNLSVIQYNQFNRISLISKEKKERCTIDLELKIKNNIDDISLEELVILELKRDNLVETSPLVSLLKEFKIRQKGLSKYCTGRAILEPGLKSNKFKPRILYLNNKILTNQLQYFT